jgi:hypothetical protein
MQITEINQWEEAMKRIITSLCMLVTIMLWSGLVEANEGKVNNWDSITIAPKLGYAYFMETSGTSNKVLERNAFNLQFDVDFGGDGSGFDLGFIYSYETGAFSTSFHALGLYLGWSYRINVDGRWYPYIGLGTRLAYLLGDGLDAGLELYPRIPIGVNYYVTEDIGVFVEIGPGFGASLTLPSGGSFGAGYGFYIDAMAGVRWP